MKTFFISDLHLGHTNLAKNIRGFDNIEDHDNYVIEMFNSVVTSKKDIVYILGDITMEKSSPYHLLDKLNGIKHVVLGNHDRHQDVHKLLYHVQSVSGMIDYKRNFILSHAPIHPQELYGKINIHGHVHKKSIPDPRYINVCCEVVDYKPKTIEELLNK